MKKLVMLLASVFLLAACGGNEEDTSTIDSVEPVTIQEKTEPTQDELDAQLKEDAIALDFVSANGDKVNEGTKVTITGEVTNVMNEGVGGEFTVTTEENDGFGMYTIKNFSMEEVKKGDIVTLYGVYDGKDATSIPLITVTVIE